MQFGGGLGISDPTNRERSPPTTNKYARRGDIVFVGGGAAIVIGLSIFGGLTYFDTFHTSLPKPVAEKPESLRTFGFSKRRSPSCCLSGSHSARSAAPGHRRVLTLTVKVRRTGSRKFSSPRRAGAASMASCSTRWCTAPISRNSMVMCSDGGGLRLKRVLPLQRHHPHPEHHLVADVDVVFTHEGQLAVVADTKHRQAGGYCLYRIAVPHIHRQIVLRDQNAAARVDVKGAGVDLLRLDVLDRSRLAGGLIDRIHDDAVFTALEDWLALKLDRGLGTVCPVKIAAVGMDMHCAGCLPCLDIIGLGQCFRTVGDLRFDPAALHQIGV